MVGDRPTLAATWPPSARGRAGGGPARAGAPRAAGPAGPARRVSCWACWSSRSATRCRSPRSRSACSPGWPHQAGLVLRGARLRAELERRAVELSARADELRLSRQRLVDAQDNERQALERDVHDGAQQHLVALAVNLRLAHTLAAGSPDRAAQLLAGQETAAADAVETVLQLTRGIYPPLLAEGGLGGRVARRAGQQPDAGRARRRVRRSLPAWPGGGGVLLLPGGAPERREVLRSVADRRGAARCAPTGR